MVPHLFDTSFLIDFQREKRRAGDGPAHLFLKANRGLPMRLPVIALGEFAEGFESLEDRVLQATCNAFDVITVDGDTAMEYSRITRHLRAEGRLIGANDLWIAATALWHDLPLVTGNLKNFSRVPGLKLISY